VSREVGPPLIQIVIENPGGAAQVLAVVRNSVSIGRSGDQNDIILADPLVSRKHVRLTKGTDGWTIEDLNSRHGTLLEGRPLHGRAPLALGARFRVGSTHLRIQAVVTAASSTQNLADLHDDVHDHGPELVGVSPAIAEVRKLLAKMAPSTAPVLLLGESGTGKEIAANLLHRLSPRAHKPFVVVNCPALPGTLVESELFGVEKNVATGVSARPGKLEECDGGTLFLDEIGDLALPVQAMLLRFLQEKTIERIGGRRSRPLDVRVVAATHHDLPVNVSKGLFRLDLYYRLNALTIVMPPLRERREDIPLLVDHFLDKHTQGAKSAGRAFQERLQRYDFPGNVRELEALVARTALLTEGRILQDVMTPAARPGAVIATEANGVWGEERRRRIEAPDVQTGDDEAAARALLAQVLERKAFWELVHEPFLRRRLGAPVVRRLIAMALADSGDSLRVVASRFGITSPKEVKKMADFLRNHDLRAGMDDPAVGGVRRGDD